MSNNILDTTAITSYASDDCIYVVNVSEAAADQDSYITMANFWANPMAIGATTPAEITGTTVYGTTFDTNVAAAGVTLVGTTLAADGTDSNISITVTPKGTGTVDVGGVSIGSGLVDGRDVAADGTTLDALNAAVVLQGTWDASAGTFPGGGTAQAGASYIVSTGGTVDGEVFTANDRIVAITDNASTSTYASNWHKLDYTDAVLSVAGATGAVTLVDMGLEIGVDVQAYDADLDALAGLTSAANKIPMFSGSGTATLIDFKDEDAMTSDSATAVASQQSIKAYCAGLVAGEPIGTLSNVGDDTATSGNLMVADGDSWESVAVSGDATLTSAGVLSVTRINDRTGSYTGSIAFGNGAGNLSTGGEYDTFVGIGAGVANTSGYLNTNIGYNAGAAITGADNNTSVGGMALETATTNGGNTAIGTKALRYVTGSGNVGVGYLAMAYASSSGSNNVAMGGSALYRITSGTGNVAIGNNALSYITTGNSNVALGGDAGKYITGGVTANQTSGTSVYIGSSTRASADGNANEVVIGDQVTGNGTNTVTIGNSSITDTYLAGLLHVDDMLIKATSSDHEATGLKESVTVGESVVFGDLLYMKSDGKWWKADADATTTMPGARLALETKAADATCSVLMIGNARDDTWAWTVGGLIYASTLTQTAPSATGDQVQVVGIATHADKMSFNPSLVLVEVA
jgi:hypothetical protein